MEKPGAVLDTEAVIDARPIGGLQKSIATLSACALFVEGFDTAVIGYIAPQISHLWHLSSDTLGTILSADLLGLLVGYLLVAPLSARFGHRRMVVACTAAFGALTFLTVSATGVVLLIAYRFLTGIGVGGAMPSAVALTGEFFPQCRRSTSITLIYIGLTLGQIAAGGVANFLLEPFGWRAVLMAGGAGTLALSALFFFALPESLEYLIHRGNNGARALVILRRLAPDMTIPDSTRLVYGGGARRAVEIAHLLEGNRALGTLCIWAGMFMNLMIFYLLAKWLPQLLVQAGLSQSLAIAATMVSLTGGIAAAFIVGPLMDRIGPYIVVVGLFAASAMAVAALAWVISSRATIPIMATALGVGFCLSGGQKANNALAVYFYPTMLRGPGLGYALGIGRVGGWLGPIAAGLLLSRGWGASGLFYVASAPMVLGACAIAAMAYFYANDAPSRVPLSRNMSSPP